MRHRPRKTHLLVAVAPDNENQILGIVGAYGAERTALRDQAALLVSNTEEFYRTGDAHWLTRRYKVVTMKVR